MKRSDNLIRALSFLIFIALACYIGFYIHERVSNPFITAKAAAVQTAESIALEGYVVRDERALWVEGEYYSYEAREGQKLGAGQPVAAVYSGEAAYARSQQRRSLAAERESLLALAAAGGAESALYDSLSALNRAARRGDAAGLESAAVGLESLLIGGGTDIEARIEEIDARLAQIDGAGGDDTSYITAPEAGLFVAQSDGHERVGTGSIYGLSPTELAALFSTAAPGDCKLVTGIGWRFAAAVEAEEAALLDEGDKVYLALDSLAGQRLEMTVDYVGGADTWGKCTVILTSSKDLEKVLTLREEKGQIILWEDAAVSIPKDAIIRDKNGEAFVYVVSGLQARRVDIEIIELRDGEATVRSDDRRLYVGAEIIVEGSGLYDGKVVG